MSLLSLFVTAFSLSVILLSFQKVFLTSLLAVIKSSGRMIDTSGR